MVPPMPSAPTRQRFATTLVMLLLIGTTAATALVRASPGPALLHLLLAAAAFPLILAVMPYFAAVLTRRPPARGLVRALPWIALAAGLFASYGNHMDTRALVPAAALALLAAGAMLAWMVREQLRAVGRVHPGLLWYQVALGALLLGLGAVLAGLLMPAHLLAAREVHRHLNLFGFFGVTAIGTLQVLLPTAAAYADAHAAARLRRDLPLAAGGALLLSLGAAWWTPAMWAGAGLWLWVAAALARSAWPARRQLFAVHSPAAPLLAALVGWLMVLAAAATRSPALLNVFLAGFLLPLVTGAATQLLPHWAAPGANTATVKQLRTTLAWGGGLRAAIYAVAGVLALAGAPAAGWLAAASTAAFLVQAIVFFRTLRRRNRMAH